MSQALINFLGKVTNLTNGTVKTELTGSLAKLSTEPLPTGQEGWTLLSYDVATKEITVYKYISGDWREL